MSRAYFDLMTGISRATDEVIAAYMAPLDAEVSHLPLKRHGHPRLRDLQVRCGYELAGGRDWARALPPLCAALEVLNCSTYVINWMLDEKAGYDSPAHKRGLVIAGFQLRETAQRILHDHGMHDFAPLLAEINHEIYVGQQMDIADLVVARLPEYTDGDRFMAAYRRRCRLLSGVFYGRCFYAGTAAAGAPDDGLFEMGARYGAATQAANDFGDFALPVRRLDKLEKPYQDQFSDFVNGKLTLAVYLMTTRGDDAQRARLAELRAEGVVDEADYRDILRILVETGAYADCKRYLKDEHKACKAMLYAHPRSPARDTVAEILVRITSNKFLSQLRKNLAMFDLTP